MPTTPITWTGLVNATVNGDGHLEKTSGSDNCFTNASGTGDAGARSVETISSGDWEFGCTLTEGRSFIGIDQGSFSLDFADWQYCIHLSTEENTSGTPHPANSIFIYQGSPPNKTYLDGIWQPGDLFRFVCQNGVVRAYLNSLLVYTFPNAPFYSIFACISMACLDTEVVDPYFITGVTGQNPCETGSDTEGACGDPWTFPTIAAYPLPANGGPRPAYFQEVDGDWGEHTQKFADGTSQANTIQNSPIRIFRAEYEGLSEAEANTLDAHYHSTRGGLKFQLTHPYTSEVINGVRYREYSRSNHEQLWSQARSVELIKYVGS